MANNNQSPIPADARQREQALTMGESFCVTAPAGSGKTELLTRRVLKLLAYCNEPEEILCITFTRKAAAEMKTRIMDTLIKGENPEAPDNEYDKQQWLLARAACQRDESKNWQLLKNPNRLRIQTIDSFCHSLTRQLPLLSRMGASVSVCEEAEHYYQQASANLLSSIEDNSPCAEALVTVLDHMDNDVAKVEQLFITMLRKRDQWLPHTESTAQTDEIRTLLESWLQEVIEEHLQQAQELLQAYEQQLVDLANYAASNLAKKGKEHLLLSCIDLDTLPKTNFENLEQWLGISELLLTKNATFRKSVNTSIGFDSDGKGEEKLLQKEKKQQHKELIESLNKQIAEELALIRTLPSPHYNDQQWEVLGALSTALKFLAAHLKLVFQEHGEVDYPEVMAAALLALGDENQVMDLALLLDQQINHILIDEFQDTSILQFRLVEQLIATWTPDDNRTLFLVGDGMQSIYKFRNANVGLFLKARDSGIGQLPLTPLSLTVNFRSQANIIDWVNHHFSRAFPQKEQENISLGAISYAPSDTFHSSNTQNNSVSNTISEVKSFAFTGDNNKRREALQVLHLVQQTLENNPQHNIGILVRTRSHLEAILPVLYDAGIRWQANELDSLSNNQLIQDLLTLTRALSQLSDRTAWLALLRTPFCGLNLKDLHALATYKHEASFQISIWQAILNYEEIKNLSLDAGARLNRIRRVLQDALNDKHRKPVRSWIEGAWYALGGPLVANDNELNDVSAFFQLLDQLESAGQVDVNLLAERIDKLYAQTDPNAPATLQVMTIHKSKGLEFDTVIIPGLDRSPRSDDTPILRWYERINKHGQERLLLAPIEGPGQNADPIFDYIKYEEKRKTELETTRLLYVACTRAKSHLYLTACLNENEIFEDKITTEAAQRDNGGEIKAPASASLLASIWPELEKQCIINPEIKTNALNTRHEVADDRLRKIVNNWNLPPLPEGHLLKNYRGQEHPQDLDNRPEFDLNTFEKHIGTVTHEALYTLSKASAEQQAHNWQPNNLDQYLPLWQNRLKQMGIDNNLAEQGSEKIKALIASTLQCESAQWILSSNHRQAESELPLTVYAQGQSKEYIIDRTFVDKNDVRWIIDYKTSSPSIKSDTQTFLDMETQKYRTQLLHYKEAFNKLETRVIKTALYFPALQLMFEVN